mgnify:CR=1 FL=1
MKIVLRTSRGLFIGAIFGVTFSLSISLIFMLFAQGFAGGSTSLTGESWLYFATVIPFLLTFMILGVYFSKREKVSNKKLWLLSIISALFITLYSATIGAIFGETIVRGGMETINIEDTLIWGTIYAFISLPFTTPLARLFIQLFIELLKKYKSTS